MGLLLTCLALAQASQAVGQALLPQDDDSAQRAVLLLRKKALGSSLASQITEGTLLHKHAWCLHHWTCMQSLIGLHEPD